MLARPLRDCITMCFTARVPADQSSHRRAGPVKGGKLNDMALAMEREQTAYSSLLMLSGAAPADPKPMIAHLVSDTVA